MHESERNRSGDSDPLGEIIRAAGRRPEPPPQHYEQVYAAARSAWRGKLSLRRKRRWFALAASLAIVGIAALLSTILVSGRSDPAATLILVRGPVEQFSSAAQVWTAIAADNEILEPGARLRVGEGGGANLRLTDGGSLRIDADTEVVIETAAVRLAAGRVYFDSAGRVASAPIAVRTTFGVIRDIGTQFEASVRSDSLRLRVREGEIVLQPSTAEAESAAQREFRSAAGQQLEMSVAGEIRSGIIAPDDAAWRWAESLALPPAPASRSVLVYLRWIARETGKRLEFVSVNVELAAGMANFVGDPAGLSPLEVLSHIAATSDFRYQLTEDGAILLERN